MSFLFQSKYDLIFSTYLHQITTCCVFLIILHYILCFILLSAII
nr:MAG TPA: hypothetical protein [Caudoviricetes sp.]